MSQYVVFNASVTDATSRSSAMNAGLSVALAKK